MNNNLEINELTFFGLGHGRGNPDQSKQTSKSLPLWEFTVVDYNKIHVRPINIYKYIVNVNYIAWLQPNGLYLLFKMQEIKQLQRFYIWSD